MTISFDGYFFFFSKLAFSKEGYQSTALKTDMIFIVCYEKGIIKRITFANYVVLVNNVSLFKFILLILSFLQFIPFPWGKHESLQAKSR